MWLQITRSARLEDIRLTILNNLMLYHPESTEELSWGIRARTSGNESDGGGPTLGVRSRCVPLLVLGEEVVPASVWHISVKTQQPHKARRGCVTL